jgi:hypothetical protein
VPSVYGAVVAGGWTAGFKKPGRLQEARHATGRR